MGAYDQSTAPYGIPPSNTIINPDGSLTYQTDTQSVSIPGTGGTNSGSSNTTQQTQPTNTGLDPHINPATGVWDDNYYAQTNGGGGGGIDTGAATNAINQGYDAYFASLNEIMNSYLPQQQTTQQGIAESQYGQGMNSLNTQRWLQEQLLNAQRGKVQGQQKKTLADISSNLRNAYMAGNVYLGGRGAGDSSAANQYSYALTKMGNQQRGDVNTQYAGIQNDIMGRESALQTTYAGAVKDLDFQKSQKISEIAQWFSEQQMALKQAQAQGQISKAQDLATISTNLLQMAQQRLATVQSETANRRSMLEQWAMNNATTIEGLKQNLAQVGSPIQGNTAVQATPFASLNSATGNIPQQQTALSMNYGRGAGGSNEWENPFKQQIG